MNYRENLEELHKYIYQRDVSNALKKEFFMYEKYVKPLEDENHHYRCFRDWSRLMCQMGQFFKKGPYEADPEKIAFFTHNGAMLGHTEVLLELLKNKGDRDVTVFIHSTPKSRFPQILKELGVKLVILGNSPNLLDDFRKMQNIIREERIQTLVWVSSPVSSSFALGMRLANNQVYWTLRYHTITLPVIDKYITGWGKEGEKVVGNTVWKVCPAPLAVSVTDVDREEVERVRSLFEEKKLVGVIAREEKTAHPDFLRAVVRILKENPDTGFIYAGRENPQSITDFFKRQGVSKRTHFVGWVNPAVYLRVIDVFLETFPLGCGVVPYMALYMGLPYVGMELPYTVFGNTKTLMLETASNSDEYVSLANRMLANEDFRRAMGSASKAFYDWEKGKSKSYSEMFFDECIGKSSALQRVA